MPALAPLASLTHGQKHWDPKCLVAVATDLERNRGDSLVIAGRRQPAAVHALAAALNVALGNLGNTVEFGAPLTADPTAGVAPLGALAEEIAAGGVDTLVITAPNPVYGAPVDLKLGQAARAGPEHHLLRRSTRTRRPPPARRSSRRRTRWSPGATCAPPTERCRSCSR